VAEPRSAPSRLDRSDRIRSNRDPRQQHRARGDRRDDQSILSTHLNDRAHRREIVGGLHGRPVVATGRKAGRLPSGIDTPHLHRHRGEAGHAQRQNDCQRRDGEGSLDGDGATIGG
jgi:hypothetical protein